MTYLKLIPEEAMRVMMHSRWDVAQRQAINKEVDGLVFEEFLELDSLSRDELHNGTVLDMYKISFSDVAFNSLFNDKELYEFLGLLYLARLFSSPINREAFLKNNSEVREEELLDIVKHGSLHAVSPPVSPELSATIEKVLSSEFFTHNPKRYTEENSHLSPVLDHIRERRKVLATDASPDAQLVVEQFTLLEKSIVDVYELVNSGPRRDVSEFETCRREQAFKELTKHDYERLLAAAQRNGFFYDLISLRPSACDYLSHEQALLECAEHARLWLLEVDLPVYYTFPSLRYSELAKNDMITPVEFEAWHSPIGFRTKFMSAKEKNLRRLTLADIWNGRKNRSREITVEQLVDMEAYEPREKYKALSTSRRRELDEFLLGPEQKERETTKQEIVEKAAKGEENQKVDTKRKKPRMDPFKKRLIKQKNRRQVNQ